MPTTPDETPPAPASEAGDEVTFVRHTPDSPVVPSEDESPVPLTPPPEAHDDEASRLLEESARTLKTKALAEEAEQGFLASLLIGGLSTYNEISVEGFAHFPAEWFFNPIHRLLYPVIVKACQDDSDMEISTIAESLRADGHLEQVGGLDYLTHLYNLTPTPANAAYYASVMEGCACQRQIIAQGEGILARARGQNGGSESRKILADAVRGFYAIAEKDWRGNSVPLGVASCKENVMEVIETIEKLYDKRGSITGLGTGIVELNKILNGLHPGQVTLVAGRPSMGKSSFVRSIVDHVTIREKRAAAVYSLKATAQQYVQAMLCAKSGVNLQRINSGFLSERDFPNLIQAASALADAHIFLDDTAPLTIEELRAKARQMKTLHDISLVVVDRVHLLGAQNVPRDASRTQIVTEVAIGLKLMARELHVPVLVIASLNRGPEGRGGGIPRLSDLRDSGSLEENADVVLMLHRKDYYAGEDDAEELAGQVDLIVAKQPAGVLGSVSMSLEVSCLRFTENNLPEPEPAQAPAPPPKKKTGRRSRDHS